MLMPSSEYFRLTAILTISTNAMVFIRIDSIILSIFSVFRGFIFTIPALYTIPSSLILFSLQNLKIFSILARSFKSYTKYLTLGPKSSHIACSFFSLRPIKTKEQPILAKYLAVVSPMPEDAPVINIFLTAYDTSTQYLYITYMLQRLSNLNQKYTSPYLITKILSDMLYALDQ